MALKQVAGRNERGVWALLEELPPEAWSRTALGFALEVPYYIEVVHMDLLGFVMVTGSTHSFSTAVAPVHTAAVAAHQMSGVDTIAAAAHHEFMVGAGHHHDFRVEAQ